MLSLKMCPSFSGSLARLATLLFSRERSLSATGAGATTNDTTCDGRFKSGIYIVPHFGIIALVPRGLHRTEQAFGSHPQALGIIVVEDLPAVYQAYRNASLKYAYKFAHLPEGVKERYTDPGSLYSFGWSHGKEIMNGKPDTLKGSYYANPIIDIPDVPPQLREQYPEYYRNNIWPNSEEEGIRGFEDAFKDLGRFVFKVGCDLAVACQPFVSKHLTDMSISLPNLIKTSQTTKARLLHYFPPRLGATVSVEDEPIDSWCGFHLDNSLLTGLCSAMFLREGDDKGEPSPVSSPSPASGLYIRTRGGELTKVSIPTDCLAFQTGECLELVTEKRLMATPHCVHIGRGQEKVSRETFALFMQPDAEQKVSATETFGQFSKRIFAAHYEHSSI